MPVSPSWYQKVQSKLTAAGIFVRVEIIGAKVRGIISKELYVDIYYDPTTSSYSYALIDQTLAYPGDKRLFGWDDYPHENVPEIKQLASFPHHFQKRSQGKWVFEESPMCGNVESEIDLVIDMVRSYLKNSP